VLRVRRQIFAKEKNWEASVDIGRAENVSVRSED
jgi:hypothetical protein